MRTFDWRFGYQAILLATVMVGAAFWFLGCRTNSAEAIINRYQQREDKLDQTFKSMMLECDNQPNSAECKHEATEWWLQSSRELFDEELNEISAQWKGAKR